MITCAEVVTPYQHATSQHLIEESLDDDLAIFYFIDTYLIILCSRLSLEGHIQVHVARELISDDDRVTKVESMHLVYHTIGLYPFMSYGFNALYPFGKLTSWGFDTYRMIGVKFDMGLLPLTDTT